MKIDNLCEKIDALGQALQELEQERDDLLQKYQEECSLRELVESQVSGLESVVRETKREKEELQQEKEGLQQKYDDLVGSQAHLERELNSYKERVEEMERNNRNKTMIPLKYKVGVAAVVGMAAVVGVGIFNWSYHPLSRDELKSRPEPESKYELKADIKTDSSNIKKVETNVSSDTLLSAPSLKNLISPAEEGTLLEEKGAIELPLKGEHSVKPPLAVNWDFTFLKYYGRRDSQKIFQFKAGAEYDKCSFTSIKSAKTIGEYHLDNIVAHHTYSFGPEKLCPQNSSCDIQVNVKCSRASQVSEKSYPVEVNPIVWLDITKKISCTESKSWQMPFRFEYEGKKVSPQCTTSSLGIIVEEKNIKGTCPASATKFTLKCTYQNENKNQEITISPAQK